MAVNSKIYLVEVSMYRRSAEYFNDGGSIVYVWRSRNGRRSYRAYPDWWARRSKRNHLARGHQMQRIMEDSNE